MALLPLLLLLAYDPALWQFYPRMDRVNCIAAGTRNLYIAVPDGIYILDRAGLDLERTLTRADGIEGVARLCAWNRARNELVIVARDGAVDRLWSWNPLLDRARELDPPFEEIRSLGVNDQGAWFDTEDGPFLKEKLIDRYEEVAGFPPDIEWFGERYPHAVRDFPILTPYFATDDQLIQYDLTMVYPDPRSSRLFVAARDFGVLVYSGRTGFTEDRVRLGPTPSTVRHIVKADGRLWFLDTDRAVSLDDQGDWRFRRTTAADLPEPGQRLLAAGLLELGRSEGLSALAVDSATVWAGSGDGIYEVKPAGRARLVARLPGDINALTRLDQSVIAGTDFGLFAWTADTLVEIQDPFGRAAFGVHSLAREPGGRLWVGVRGGILRFGGDDDWDQLVPPGFPLDREVSALAAAGNIVFYDNGSGVTAWDASDSTWTTIGPQEGLHLDPLTALWADSNYLWLAAPGMLARLEYRPLLPRD